jgi:hypothetical protein
MKKWKKFEKLVAKVQRDLSPNALVLWDQYLQGKKTKVKRQIDILVKQNVGQFELLIAIDCKDEATPIDVKAVEETIGLFQDIEANKGAIVSAKGFTKAAKNLARNTGIELYCLIDSGNHDWKTIISIPIIFDYKIIKNYSYSILGPIPKNFDCANHQGLELFTEDFQFVGTIHDVLVNLWKERRLPYTQGTHKGIQIYDNLVNIKFNNDFFKVKILVNIEVDREFYLQMLPLKEILGFEDQLRGGIITKGFTTSEIELNNIKKNSKKIKNVEDLAIKPIFCFEIFPGGTTKEN